ncbi:uncharacterized protein MONOS_17888 [Monocercomonoides exilis]|uniref:uncharacterized protein n=1 Tax=Monocercomonoides exilis TaxID=2049356 RepID=UPI003559A1C9|nr:hypothetical protein MONOS_17888 [Monocercomonoides exilis]
MFAMERNSEWRPFSGIGVDLCGLPAERDRQRVMFEGRNRKHQVQSEAAQFKGNCEWMSFGEIDEEIDEAQRDGRISEGKEEATTQEQSMNSGHPIQLFTYQIQYFFSMTASHEAFSSFSSEISFDLLHISLSPHLFFFFFFIQQK